MEDRGMFELSTYLKTKRKQYGMTQTELAERTGLTSAYISQIENGKRKKPSREVIKKFAKVLSIPNIEVMQLLEFIADEADETKNAQEPAKNIQWFDITGLSEKDIQHIQEQIELLKIRAEREKNKNG
ncbi:helix-turn-helix domain-containing protein [Bacillus subtilis]|uniref:helix-turn-helix domain-containing protein n=1 Tax=Bacillus subtilis TaxID=1423 RepID=UPI002795AF49|nr:helix-turn-helix domain-containing protein [Bacillus subtilis]